MPKAKEAPEATPEVAEQPKLTAADVLKSFDRLSPEERAKLAAIGTVIPSGADETTLTGTPQWGYRCIHCNGLSLYFPGTKFGTEGYPRPVGGLSVREIPIMQIRGTDEPVKVDLSRLLCPNCGGGIPLSQSAGLLEEHIREVSVHQAVIDQHFTNYASREIARKRRTMPTVDMQGAANHDRLTVPPASQLMGAQDRADVEYAASQPGFLEAVAREMGKK